jgi:hypothetical protein
MVANAMAFLLKIINQVHIDAHFIKFVYLNFLKAILYNWTFDD